MWIFLSIVCLVVSGSGMGEEEGRKEGRKEGTYVLEGGGEVVGVFGG